MTDNNRPWRYAISSGVTKERSQEEIRKLVKRIGGTMFSIGWVDETTEAVMFKVQGTPLLFRVEHPPETDLTLKRVKETLTANRVGGQIKRPQTPEDAVEVEVNRRWRCVVIQIKAMVSMMMDAGVEFSDAFMPNIALSRNSTVGDVWREQVDTLRDTGQLPALTMGDKR